MSQWYTINNIDALDSPALVVYPDRVAANIRLAVEMAGGAERLRPHVKTHKSPGATRLMLEAGIKKFKCATIAEAEMLAQAGAPDVLLAYQPIGPKAERLVRLVEKYAGSSFACLVDNIDSARAMSAVFKAAGLRVPVYMDLDVGMGRTGIVPGPGAVQLYKESAALEGVEMVGLHAYDGHIRDKDLVERKKRIDTAFAKVEALNESLGLQSIVAGGSPSFAVHCSRPGIECSPGTFVYWDKGYGEGLPEQLFQPAALVVTRVVSLLGESRLCLDLGHKSIAAENELGRRVSFLNAPELNPVGQSEEHLVVEAQPRHGYRPGDVLYGIPFHICPTVALYERALTIKGGNWDGEWRNSARDRRISV